MKRFVLFALLLVSAAALFAAPVSEPDGDETSSDGLSRGFGRSYSDRPFGPGLFDGGETWNPVEITGTIEFIENRPILVADGKTYLIGAPMAMLYADEVEEGTEVVIRGQLVEGLSNDLVEYNVDGHITVEQVEIDGEVLSLDRFAMGRRGNSSFDDRRPFGEESQGGPRMNRMPRRTR